MSEYLKIAIVACITIVIVNAMQIYFSPFQTCLRAAPNNEMRCASIAGGQIRMTGSVSMDGSVSLDR